MRIISQRVAPSAERGLLVVGGTVAITSRLIALTIGRIMIASIEPGDEVVGDRDRAAADERDERQAVGEPLLGRLQLGREEEDAPQAVDDRRDGRQQLDQDRERAAQAQRAQLGRVQRRGDRDRHADQQRQRRR